VRGKLQGVEFVRGKLQGGRIPLGRLHSTNASGPGQGAPPVPCRVVEQDQTRLQPRPHTSVAPYSGRPHRVLVPVAQSGATFQEVVSYYEAVIPGLSTNMKFLWA
jgi:hypothetical protein